MNRNISTPICWLSSHGTVRPVLNIYEINGEGVTGDETLCGIQLICYKPKRKKI